MKHLLFCLLAGLLLCSCSTMRQLERAEKLLADHQRTVPPDTVYRQLLAANPKLAARAVRTVVKVVHDTVWRQGKNVYLPGPPLNVPPPAPSRLVDSLMRAATRQLRAKDSLDFSIRLRTALAARPRTRADTLKLRVGELLVRTWIDQAGAAHTTATNLRSHEVVVRRVVPPPRHVPVSAPAKTTGLWAFVNEHFGAVVAGLVICLLWVLLGFRMRRRPRPYCAGPYLYCPYSHKP